MKAFFVVMLALAAGCTPGPRAGLEADSSRPWLYADLRVVDAVDQVPPERDIVAAYARVSGTDIEIRVDMLRARSVHDYDLYLALDSRPGGQRALPVEGAGELDWEQWIAFPAYGSASAVNADGSAPRQFSARLFRDLDQDAAVVRLRRADLSTVPERMRFQVFLTEPNSKNVVEQSAVFRFDNRPPRQRARLLLAFWNTLPAQTPAQALRRWDGAHTGPAGHRHGLYQILKAVESARVPVALLDLKTADSLAGLEQVSGLGLVQKLNALGLVWLPDAAVGDPRAAATALELSRKAAARYGLSASPAAYASFSEQAPGGYRVIFASQPGLEDVVQQGALRVAPLPHPSQEPDADTQGLSLAARRRLVDAAVGAGPGLVALGGDVQNSMWADAEVAGPALRYIANHPWIQALNENDLLAGPAGQADASETGCVDPFCPPTINPPQENLRAQLRQELARLPEGAWRETAWSMYLRLTQPDSDARRSALRAGYLGQVGHLLAAARWLEKPGERAECGLDVDFDNQGECVLASGELFTILEPNGARLALAVYRDADGPQEWVAPPGQFGLGLGAEDEWQPEKGEAGDPRVIPGGLADLPDSFAVYQPSRRPGEIRFSGSGGEEKIYRLVQGRIEVEYRNIDALTTRIPLALGAGEAREPGWGRQFIIEQDSPGSFSWRDAGQSGVRVITGAAIQARSPLDSLAWMRFEEDPDREYPPGHFTPYPLAELTLQANGPFRVSIGKN